MMEIIDLIPIEVTGFLLYIAILIIFAGVGCLVVYIIFEITTVVFNIFYFISPYVFGFAIVLLPLIVVSLFLYKIFNYLIPFLIASIIIAAIVDIYFYFEDKKG